jgi:hypothetical protein
MKWFVETLGALLERFIVIIKPYFDAYLILESKMLLKEFQELQKMEQQKTRIKENVKKLTKKELDDSTVSSDFAK